MELVIFDKDLRRFSRVYVVIFDMWHVMQKYSTYIFTGDRFEIRRQRKFPRAWHMALEALKYELRAPILARAMP